MIRRFARPYARALMDIAGSPQAAGAVRTELVSFQRALAESPELRAVYANPAFDLDSKITLTRQLATRMNLSELATRMLEVLVRSNRVNDITGILEAVAEYVNAATGVAVAEVRSAKPLTPDEQNELSTTLSRKVGKSVELDVQTDPALLGGIVVKIGSEIWDASVAGKIQKFRASLT
jgi:F-type H+-transporting ATPase subunit delta